MSKIFSGKIRIGNIFFNDGGGFKEKTFVSFVAGNKFHIRTNFLHEFSNQFSSGLNYVPDLQLENLNTEWFGKIIICTTLESFDLTSLSIKHSNKNYRNMTDFHIRFDCAAKFNTIHLWHHYIAYHDLRQHFV